MLAGLLALPLLLAPTLVVAPPVQADPAVARIDAALRALYPGVGGVWLGPSPTVRARADERGLLIEIHRPATGRVLTARLPGLTEADDATLREALSHTVRYVLEAPPGAGRPATRRTRAAIPPAPRPIPEADAVPPDHLAELVPPLPAFPSRPPLVIPVPPPVPAPSPPAVVVWRDAPGEEPDHSRSDTVAAALPAAPPAPRPTDAEATRLWLGVDLVWAGAATGGLALGAAQPISGLWAVRAEASFEPFGAVQGPEGDLPLVDLRGAVAIERRLTGGAAAARLHAGLGWHELFAETDAVTIESGRRPFALVGASLGLPLGGPVSLGLQLDARAAPWALEARGAGGQARRPQVGGRLGASLSWRL